MIGCNEQWAAAAQNVFVIDHNFAAIKTEKNSCRKKQCSV